MSKNKGRHPTANFLHPIHVGYIGVLNVDIWVADSCEVGEFCTLDGSVRDAAEGEWVLVGHDPAMEETNLDLILGRVSQRKAIQLAKNVILKRGGVADAA